MKKATVLLLAAVITLSIMLPAFAAGEPLLTNSRPAMLAASISRSFTQTAGHIGLHVLIALVIAGITILVLRGQLKSIYAQGGATQYAQSGLKLTHASDQYLYEHTTRTPRPKDNGKSSKGKS